MLRIIHKNYLYLILARLNSRIQSQTLQQHGQISLRQFATYQRCKMCRHILTHAVKESCINQNYIRSKGYFLFHIS